MANIGEAQISKSHLLVRPAILLGLTSKIMVRPYVFRFGKIHDSHDSPLLSYSLFGEAHKRFIGEAQPI